MVVDRAGLLMGLVLVTSGYEGTTTKAVAERAGVSIGSLYQYFPSKEALVAMMLERFHQLRALRSAVWAAVVERPELMATPELVEELSTLVLGYLRPPGDPRISPRA
jgi:AcrR family transcriptional regulator